MKTGLNNVVLPTLFNVVNNIVQHCYTQLQPGFRLNNMFSIVDNIEQCGQHNIVQSCFQQPSTTRNFHACIVVVILGRSVAKLECYWGRGCVKLLIFVFCRLISFEINVISKESSQAEPEYVSIHPPPIHARASPPDDELFKRRCLQIR